MISSLRRPLRSTVPALQAWCRAASSTTRKTRKNAESLDEPDLRIVPGSDNHHDLPSFIAYAERVDLSRKASVYVGTHYEYTVATTLTRLGFKLTRTGRARDYGIDLLGSWTLPIPASWSTNPPSSKASIAGGATATDSPALLPGPTRPLRVLVQCKSSNKKLGPDKVRELEGAFTGAPTEWRQEDFLGLLATTNSATKGIMEALQRSRWPMGFLKIDHDGRIEQFLWNRSAQARGLEGLGVTVRYLLPPIAEQGTCSEEKTKKRGSTKKVESETAWTDVGLTWDGWPLPYLKSEEVEALEGLNMEEVELVEETAEAKAEQDDLNSKVKKTRDQRKKSDLDEELSLEGEEKKTLARRGRKKKDAQVDVSTTNVEIVEEYQESVRELGEDEPTPVAPVEKRGRGRPRKARA